MVDPASISSGRSLPHWMRTRPDLKHDVGGLPNSPPAHDDSFFYIRYPVPPDNNSLTEQKTNVRTITATISEIDKKQISTTNSNHTLATADFTKHTEPCKKFMTQNGSESVAPPFVGSKNTKPFGTDDGFKGAGAACGSSIVRVAHQMVTGKSFSRGFTVANFNKNSSENSNDPMAEIEDPLVSSSRLMNRRGSKSLPASPLGSPKAMRKFQPNPYFTGAYTVGTNNTTGDGNNSGGDNNRSGWLMSSLLGIQREQTTSTTSLASHTEEAEDIVDMYISNTNNNNQLPKVLKAKPSELREMNFWSPTSM